MRNIKVTELKAGMKFNKPVYIEGNNILVLPEIPIKQKDIDRLINWDIKEVFTDGEIFTPGAAEELLNKATDYTNDNQKLEFYNTAINNIVEIFYNIQNNSFSEFYKGIIDAIVSEIYTNIKEYESILVQKILSARLNQRNMAISAVHCALLVAIIGQAIIKEKGELFALITAAILHDIGMTQVSDVILSKKEKLTNEDIKNIRRHSEFSYNIIKKLGYSEAIARNAIHHHEKWNGVGYPGNLKAEEIPLGSRIIAVADTYIALVNNRPYRNYLIGYNAMKAILSDNGTHFDPAIIKIFLRSIGIYPLGSIVRLSDNSVGKVIGLNSKAPLRPRIQLINDSAGEKNKNGIEIDLFRQNDLFIINAMDIKQSESQKDTQRNNKE